MINLRTDSTLEEHKSVITDVCFRPNSTQLATASMDKSVRLWDTANPIRSLHEYSGHDSAVMSLDFHPKKTDLFCSCDGNDEIRYWNISSSSSCCREFKESLGGNGLVRFQPRHGNVLAAVYNKTVSVFDVETSTEIYSLQGHPEVVDYICWDPSGAVLVSVSQCLVKIWSMVSGECIQELASLPDQLFYSCVFHPSYSTLLIIGGTKCLELWNMTHNKIMTVSAHEDTISCLAQSPVTRIVASASHDSFVRLWK
ncbi:hypothetical protein PIB30_066765 [Stylosanthes scabra]|uniref:Transcriptional corepressor LEUNIG-like n=1 Tax=Stylosanthes scabra TaxID=79078 RepID=A0ABU6XMR5_9FABA|nr:hypothetical protein [Stylosanthes scabra]